MACCYFLLLVCVAIVMLLVISLALYQFKQDVIGHAIGIITWTTCCELSVSLAACRLSHILPLLGSGRYLASCFSHEILSSVIVRVSHTDRASGTV